MRYLLLFFLLYSNILLAQINQTDANDLKQGLWQKKQPNGRLIYEGHFKNNKPFGEWKRYHPGGQIKAHIIYKGDTAQTQLFDVWRKKVAEGNYLNQKKEGLWKVYDNGVIIADETYRQGIKEGPSHRYYPSGEVMEETNWKNGVQSGAHRLFFKNGEPYMQCKMQNNQRHGLCIIYFDNDREELVAEYKNNLRHGEWKYFDREGNLRYTLHYNEGQILNPEVRDSIGNLEMQALEKNKGSIVDPEKFTQDPSEYMIKKNIYK
jgi:antitoxin component YwqK of YwqJK toxin-antitoxin module